MNPLDASKLGFADDGAPIRAGVRRVVFHPDGMTLCVTLLESGHTGHFHLVLRRGTDSQGRLALLVLRGPGHHSRVQAEAARALLEVELADSGWDYSNYDCQVVIIQPDQ